MADNCSILEPWSAASGMGGHWGLDVLSRESEVLTRALQASLAHQPNINISATMNIGIDNHLQQQQQQQLLQLDHLSSCYLSSSPSMDLYSSPSSQLLPSPTTPSSASFLAQPELLPVPPPAAAPGASDSDSPTGSKRIRAGRVTTGRVSKRRPSRASKRSPTTFISADPANFRQMVQQVTGVQIPVLTGGGCHLPASSILTRPEPQRLTAAYHQGPVISGGGSCLPTLDTSAFLMDMALFGRPAAAGPSSTSCLSPPPPPPPPATAAFSSAGLDIGLPCFPTLESSWEVN